ncbi:MAG: hypothetical protein JEZ05_04675 [Tenericutes bacterium]|nr:hypothetical protein [Mycoplasmatota bacterium]
MFWKYFFIIYGILCLFIGLLKPPFIFNMSKFKTMEKMFGGRGRVVIFVLVWGLASLAVGLWVF